jgi:seryl-tRNA synthetase
MLDIRWIRDNPEALDRALASRGAEPAASRLIELDERRRACIAKAQAAQERRNAASKEIGKAKAAKDETTAQKLMAEVAALKEGLPGLEAEAKALDAELDAALSILPNVPRDDVPVGPDETGNVEYRRWGGKPDLGFAPKEHYELGEALGMMDFEAAARISGSRFVVVKGKLARLQRALGQFMLDLHTQEHGYAEVQPPVLVRAEAMFGTGQLPKFEADAFSTLKKSGEEGEPSDRLFMIPTSEVPLTNLARESILDEAALPQRYTALTPCFRSEAGAAGRDTRGMLRQHQFDKVELVSITTPEKSAEEHERMLACAEEVLKRLDIHYRVMTLCTGDMGFGAQKTYDIEVWLPGQDTYREISSCSVCGDFQARRMQARYRPANEKSTRFVHTLNGSGVAVGRALIAVMENYQQGDGSILVPDALQPYMAGTRRIEA